MGAEPPWPRGPGHTPPALWAAGTQKPDPTDTTHSDLSCVGVCSSLDREGSQTGSQWPNPTHRPIWFDLHGILLYFVVSFYEFIPNI